MIKALLAKPFKMPKPNYKGINSVFCSELCSYAFICRPGSTNLSRGLGMRRNSVRTALHDPFEDGALVLHTPHHLSAHEQLMIDTYVIVT